MSVERNEEQIDQSRHMANFWDTRARENAAYFIKCDMSSGASTTDFTAFFASGEEGVHRRLQEINYQPKGSDRLLEIGCGLGRMTRAFARSFGTVYGIDISPEMISQAQAHLTDCPNVHLSVGNGMDLAEFADASLDFVFSTLVFQHIPDPAITFSYIREIGRVLVPGGQAYFQVNTLSNLRLLARRILVRLLSLLPSRFHASWVNYAYEPAWRGSRLKRKDCERVVAEAGLVLDWMNGVGTQYTWIYCHRPHQ